MRVTSHDGNYLELEVIGYQFPDAAEPGLRYSWHMLAGEARRSGISWSFRFPALTCDETPRVSGWLREVAACLDTREHTPPADLAFTEPNLRLRLRSLEGGHALVQVDLDQEFRLPTEMKRGDPPTTLLLTVTSDELHQAAHQWDVERMPYPDGLAE